MYLSRRLILCRGLMGILSNLTVFLGQLGETNGCLIHFIEG